MLTLQTVLATTASTRVRILFRTLSSALLMHFICLLYGTHGIPHLQTVFIPTRILVPAIVIWAIIFSCLIQ